jgi:hypothetical protein
MRLEPDLSASGSNCARQAAIPLPFPARSAIASGRPMQAAHGAAASHCRPAAGVSASNAAEGFR